jgi:hypothetical protein
MVNISVINMYRVKAPTLVFCALAQITEAQAQLEMHMRRSKHFEDSRHVDLLRKRVTI